MDSSPSGSSVHGIFQVGILEWVAIPFSRGFANPGTEPRSPALYKVNLSEIQDKEGPVLPGSGLLQEQL